MTYVVVANPRHPKVSSGPYAGQAFYPVRWDLWPGIPTTTLPGWKTVFLRDDHGGEVVRDVRVIDLPREV